VHDKAQWARLQSLPILQPGPGLDTLFEAFLQWQPQAPRSAKELAEVSARLCRLLRQEVTDALARKSEALTTPATDWRELLFPTARNGNRTATSMATRGPESQTG